MNNVFAVGGRVSTLNSDAPSSRFSTTPPSPTAVAINLLNLLKIANTMSHPLFNPFVPGAQTPSQGQYGLSGGQAERGPRTGLPRLEPGSSYPSGPPPLILGTSGGLLRAPLAPPGNYRPERSRITVDDDIERCLDLNIGRPKEEVRHQPLNQNIPFIGTQSQGFPPSNTEVPSYMAPSALQGHRPSTVDSSSRSLDWLPMFKMPQENDPSKMYSSASSSALNSGDGRFNISNEGTCNTPSIPGFGNYDRNVPERSVLPPEPSRPKYTSESASNILLQFGLEKEDLEHLIAYPEDQITPQNLPFILRQIQLKKSQRAAATSKPYSEPPPIASVSGVGARGAAPLQDEIQSIVLKPSKVIDYGHTGKYTAGIEKDVGVAPPATGGSKSNLDTLKSSSHAQKPLSEPASKSQPSSSVFCSVHPNRPGLVLIGLNDEGNNSSQSSAPGQASKVKEPAKKQQGQPANQQVPQQKQQPKKLNQAQQQQKKPNQAQQQQSYQSQQMLLHQRQQQLQQKQQQQEKKQQVQQKQHQQWQRWKQQEQQVEPPQQPKGLLASHPPPPRPNAPLHLAAPQPVPSLMDTTPRMLAPTAKKPLPAKAARPKRVPTPAMMQDYAAATPRVFPHTCSLCNKACTTMKDWLAHQNTPVHLESCRRLRTEYPNWDGETLGLLSATSKDAKTSPQTRHQISRHDSPRRSHSPRRQRGSEDRRDRWLSRSRSRSPRYDRDSDDRRPRRNSRSRSPYRPYSSERRDQSWSPLRAWQSRRSRSVSPPYDRPTHSRHRSRSRSYERRSSPRRSHERRSSPWRSDDKRSSPRRSYERRSAERPQRRRSSSSERLAKKLLETPAVQSLSKKSDLETMVKTLAPALLAELSKLKSSSSSKPSSSSDVARKSSSSSSSSKTKSSLHRSEKSSSEKTKVSSTMSPNSVRLFGIYGSMSHGDINTAVETFGKTKSVVLFRMTKHAVVTFHTKEGADKLRNAKTLKVKGYSIAVDDEWDSLGKKQKTASQQNSTKSDVSTSTAKAKAPATSSEAKSTSTGKVVAKTKVLVSKAKGVSNKQVAKTVKTGNGNIKKEIKTVPISKDTQKEPDAANPEAEPPNSENKTNESEAAPNDTAKTEDEGTVAQSTEENITVKEEKDFASTEGNSLKPEEGVEQRAVKEEVCAEGQNVPSTSVTTENQLDATEGTEDEGSALEPKDSTNIETEGEATSAQPDKSVEGDLEPVSDGEFAQTELEAEATEPMEVEGSAESKDQKLTDIKTEPTDGHPETSVVKTSPIKPPDSTQTPETTFKTNETSMKASSPEQTSTEADSEPSADLIDTETLENEEETAKQKDPATEIKPEQETEPVCDISAPSPEVSEAAETNPTDEAATSQDTTTVTLDTPPVPTQTENSCVQMEPVESSPNVLDEEQSAQQDRTSPVPTTSAGSALPDSVKAESDADMEVEKLQTEVVENTTVPPTGSENVKEESPPSSVTSADTKSVPAASATTMSVSEPVTFEENASKLPPMTEDVFRAITSALRKHKLAKGGETKVEDKESADINTTSPAGVKEESTQQSQDDVEEFSSDLFDDSEINFEDFVTVDEISEDMGVESLADGSFLSEQTSKTNSDKSPFDKNTSLISSKDCKTSARSSSSSRSTKSSSSTRSTRSSELSKTKSADSVKAHSSSGQKVQPGKKKSPARGSQSSSTGRSTRSSSAAARTSAETRLSQEKKEKPTERAVKKSVHKMSAESNAAKSVESELKIETSEMDAAARGQRLESPTQTPESDFTDETLKDAKTSKDKENDGKNSEEGGDNVDNKRILDSLDEKTDDKTNLEENSGIKTIKTVPEKDGPAAAADGQVCPEDCSEMEMDSSIKEPTGDTEEAVTQVTNKADKDQTLDQTSSSVEDGAKEKYTDGTQKSNDDHSLDNMIEPSKDLTKQEVLETLNSSDGQTITKGEDQELETPTDQIFKDIGSKDEEEEEYQIIDSVEDQPTEPETDNKQQTRKGKTTLTEDRPTRSTRSRGRSSKLEDEAKSSKKQEKTVKHVTRARDSRTVKEKTIDQGTEDMVFEVVDSIEDEPIQEASTSRSSLRKQTGDEKNLEVVGQSDKEEETMYKILDSVDDETANDKPSTRSNRGRSRRAEEKVAEIDSKKDKSRRRKHTPVRETPENVGVPPKETTPTKKKDVVVKDASEDEAAYEILDAVEEDVDRPTPQKSRRGRPKKKTSAKETEALKKVDATIKVAEEKEATFQILDALEDDQCTADQTVNTEEAAIVDKTTTKATSPKTVEEDEATYQILDSVEDDPTACVGTTLPISSAKETEQAVKDLSDNAEEVKSNPSADAKRKTSTPSSKTQKSVLVHLDEVSDEEEDYPDDTGEKGELKSRRGTTEQEERRTRGRETRGQRSRSRGLEEAKDDAPIQGFDKKTAKTDDKPATSKKSKKDESTSKNILVNLDEVSEEEENYPEEAAETKQTRRQNTAKNEREERDRRERRSRSSSSRRSDGSGRTASRTKETFQDSEEKVEPQEMVTLDEVGGDEAGEEALTDAVKSDTEVTEEELQDLLTLDEIVEEENDKEQQTLDALTLDQENQSQHSSKPETSSTLDEADKEETKNTSSSVKRKHDDNTEKSEDFLTVDEVVATEEEEKETTTRSRAMKRSRQTPVRKSTRGKMGSKGPEEGEEENKEVPPASADSSSTLDKDASAPSADVQTEVQNVEAETASKPDNDMVSPEPPELQSESPDEEKPKECEEEENRNAEVKAVKRKQELFASEAKRSRSQSPSVPADFKLPPFNPQNPLGQEFVVPKSGFFCNLCSIFYLNENVAKGFHCSSQKHYDNLQKHYQKLQRKTSAPSMQSPHDDASD